MNLKIALMMFLIFSASAITVAATTFTLPAPHILGSTKTFYSLNTEVQPLGDPIDNPVFPK